MLALGVALSGQAVTRTDERLLEGTEGLSIKACLVVESLLVFYGIPRPHGTAHRCQVLIETRTPNSLWKTKEQNIIYRNATRSLLIIISSFFYDIACPFFWGE